MALLLLLSKGTIFLWLPQHSPGIFQSWVDGWAQIGAGLGHFSDATETQQPSRHEGQWTEPLV